MTRKIIMLKGLPASGKSSWARKMVQDQGHCTRVNKDDLREMMHLGKFSKANEKIVLSARNNIVIESIILGKSVIVDDTNFSSKHEVVLKGIAESLGVEFEIKFFEKRPELCIKHDLQRKNGKSVGRKVIMNMYDKFLKPDNLIYTHTEGLPKSIIVDIDGTLAHMNNKRSPYDYSKVMGDEVDSRIKNLVNMYKENGYTIIIVSGRANEEHLGITVKEMTGRWLTDKGIAFDELYLRQADDIRKDVSVKQEIFNKYIRNEYNVEIVLDDRNQTVAGWREIGLKCLQVAEGNF